MDWNDLRYFIAVARGGSTLAAGREQRVSQTTVARRIAALEAAIGFPLFDKRQAGYALNDAGRELLAHAEQVESHVLALQTAADAQARDISGTVRLTAEEIFAMTLLPPLLRELHEQQPNVRIELDTTASLRDLGAGEADVALRSASKPQASGMVGRRLCRDDWTLYCSRDYAQRHGVPRSAEDLKSHAIVGGGAGGLWRAYSNWLKQVGLEDRVAMHHGSSTGLLSAVRSGFGIAALPCIVADCDPDLIQCLPPPKDHKRAMWLLTHERVRRTPRVRLVVDFLYRRLSGQVRELERSRTVA